MVNNVKVSSIGLDGRSIETLNLVLKRNVHNITLIDSVSDAHVVLVNLETTNVAALYREFVENNPSIPVIGLYKYEIEGWAMRKLKMPIDTKELIESIMAELPDVEDEMPKSGAITDDKIAKALAAIETKKVAAKLSSKIDPDKPGIGKQREMIKKSDEMCFDIDRFLLGRIIEAVNILQKQYKAALINCWGDKSIIIQPQSGKLLTDLTDNQLRNLAIAPLDDRLSSAAEIKYLDAGELRNVIDRISKQSRSISLEAFLWDIGLQTCKGRIPLDVSIADRQYLRRWPNVTRMKLTDNALKIIAYWVRRPCSLSEIHEKLGVPLQDVFSVFTAAYSARLADKAKRESDSIIEAEDVHANKKRSLFNSLMSHLKKMNKEVA